MVTHENDRAWRTAVVMNKPSLLALRYQRTEDSYIYPYKLIRLTSKFIKFRVVKVRRLVCWVQSGIDWTSLLLSSTCMIMTVSLKNHYTCAQESQRIGLHMNIVLSRSYNNHDTLSFR